MVKRRLENNFGVIEDNNITFLFCNTVFKKDRQLNYLFALGKIEKFLRQIHIKINHRKAKFLVNLLKNTGFSSFFLPSKDKQIKETLIHLMNARGNQFFDGFGHVGHDPSSEVTIFRKES